MTKDLQSRNLIGSMTFLALIFTVISASAQAALDTLWLGSTTAGNRLGWLSAPVTGAATEYMPVRVDTSWENGTLTLAGGVQYPKGLEVPSPAGGVEVVYPLAGGFTTFMADVGVDANVGPYTSTITFEVWDGNQMIASSPPLAAGQVYSFNLNIQGWTSLGLRSWSTSPASGRNDGGIWGGARVRTGTPPAVVFQDTTWLSDVAYDSYIGYSVPTKDRADYYNSTHFAITPPKATTIQTPRFKRGYGTIDNTEMTFNIDGKGFQTFTADVFIDSASTKPTYFVSAGAMPHMSFSIYNENGFVERSPYMSWGDVHNFTVDVTGWKEIILVTTYWGYYPYTNEPIGDSLWNDQFDEAGIQQYGDWTGFFSRTGQEVFNAYPARIYVPVTFYDYHSDGTNPDFNQDPTGQDAIAADGEVLPMTGMVENHLSMPNRKPIKKIDTMFDSHLDYWWQPSGFPGNALPAGDTFGFEPSVNAYRWAAGTLKHYPGDPNYDNENGPVIMGANSHINDSIGVDYKSFLDGDNWSNVVIYDSLPFDHVGNGVYEYCNFNFLPLNNRGFGWEGIVNGYDDNKNITGDNFSFAMEMHEKFTYQKGSTFNFVGDDDCWTFINDSLVMDLGGEHNAAFGRISLDSLGLQANHKYPLDFFYCERHQDNSDIVLTTNLFAPTSLNLTVLSDTIQAGVPKAVLQAVIDDDNGNPVDSLANHVIWSIFAGSSAPGDSLYNTTGSILTLSATKPYRSFIVQAVYIDPATGIKSMTVHTIYVLPGPPAAVTIEDIPFNNGIPVIDTFTAHVRDSIMFTSAEVSKDVYAVLRDAYGTFVGFASPDWTVEKMSQVVTAGPAPGTVWTGIITRGVSSKAVDTCYVAAVQGGLSQFAQIEVIINFFVATPTPKIDTSGTYFQTISSHLSDDSADASIFYCWNCTIDTADPNLKSKLTLYAPGAALIPVSAQALTNDTLRAIARKLDAIGDTIPGWAWSAVMTAAFMPETRQCPKPLATPPGVDNPDSLTSYFQSQPVTLTLPTSTQPAGFYSIYYCLDCSDASLLALTGDSLYSGQLAVSGTPLTTDTLKAIAIKGAPGQLETGYLTSAILKEPYYCQTQKVAKPFILPAGTVWKDTVYKGTDSLVFGDVTPSTYIKYTLDGTDPDSSATALVFIPDTSPAVKISNPGSTTIKAIAYRKNNEKGWLPSDMLTETFVNLDSQGPYIKSALLYLGNLPGQTPVVLSPDTLVIVFDDSVECSGMSAALSAIFNYYSSDPGRTSASVFGNVQSMVDNCSPGGLTKSVTLIIGANSIVPLADSIQIAAGALQDQWANLSPVNGAKCPIDWGRDYDVVVSAGPNPVGPASLLFNGNPPALNTSGLPQPPKYGIAIQIVAVDSITNSVSEGTFVDIYDATGNVVITDLVPYKSGGGQNTTYFFWDVKNSDGRTVGAGTYLGVVHVRKIKATGPSDRVYRTKIGVIR